MAANIAAIHPCLRPGGQNVNKVATGVQLRFDVAHSRSLPEAVRERLNHLAGKRMIQGGYLLIDARRFRTQEQNRKDAVARGKKFNHSVSSGCNPERGHTLRISRGNLSGGLLTESRQQACEK